MKNSVIRRDFFKNLLISSSAFLLPSFVRQAFAGSKDHAPLLAQSENATLQTIHNLRTIHGNFTAQEIPQDQLDLILQASIQAPNASAMQSYSIILIKDREKMQRLCGYQGAALLLYCVDYNRLIASAQSVGYSYIPTGIESFITGSTNTILALQTAVIAAKALGIDSLTTNGIHRGDMQRLWDELDLPEKYCFPLLALVLGYPTEEPTEHKGRLDGAGIFHTQKYHTLTENEIAAITQKVDAPDSHIALSDAWRNGYEHYYAWLFDRWIGRNNDPQTVESQAFTLLKRSGFVDLQS